MTGRLPHLASAALVGTVLVLGFTYGGLGLAACLVAIGVGSALLQELVPSSGPVRWACVTVAFALYVLVSMAALGVLGTQPLSQRMALAVLLAPGVVGGAGLAWRRRAALSPAAAASPRTGRATVGAIALAVLAVPTLAASRHATAGLVWAMSGDNRNHLLGARQVIDAGGLTLDQLRGYPSGVYGLVALIAAANGRDDLAASELLQQDVNALAGVWLLVLMAVGVLSATAVILTLPGHERSRPRLTPPLGLTALAAGLLVGTGVYGGVALQDGFLPALAGLALLLAALALTIVALRQPHSWLALVLLAAATALTAYRPLFSLIVVVLLGVVIGKAVWLGHWRLDWLLVTVGAGLFTVPYLVVVLWKSRAALQLSFEAPGVIAAPSTWLPVVVGLTVLGLTVRANPGELGRSLRALVIVLVSLLGVVLWTEAATSALGPGLTYSSQKIVWAAYIVAFWAPFAVIARAFTDDTAQLTSRSAYSAGRQTVAAASVAVAALLGVSVISPVSSPVPAALDDWTRPSTEVIDVVVDNLDRGQVVVPWLYSRTADGAPNFGDDRLGIFWSMTQWGELYPHFEAWAYTLWDGDPTTLCPLMQSTPDVLVVTRDPGLEERTRDTCPNMLGGRFEVRT